MDGFNCIFLTGLSACGLWDSIGLGGPPILAQSRLTAVNWLWVVGGIVAVWILISAMARRQTRLTGVLRAHVERHKEAHKPSEIEEKPNE